MASLAGAYLTSEGHRVAHQVISGKRLIQKPTARAAVAALLLAAAASPAAAQFSTVLNLPPDTIATGTVVGSDTQVNFSDGGSMGSNIQFGASDGSSTNVQFNVFSGYVPSVTLNPGSTTNVSGGTPSNFRLNGGTLNVTAGTINRLDFISNKSEINVSGGQINAVDYVFAGTLDNPVFNISGGTVISGTGFGYYNGIIENPGILNLTGGTVTSTQRPNFFTTASLTGGTFNGAVVLVGGDGVLDGAALTNGISADNGSTVNILSGSAGYAGAGGTGVINVQADVGIGGLSFTDGGTINLNSGDLNLQQLFVYNNNFQSTTAKLNLNTGAVAIDQFMAQGPGNQHRLHMNINGSDVTGPASYQNTWGLKYLINLSAGSLTASPGSILNSVVAHNLTMTGGSIGDNTRITGIDDDYGVVSLANGTIGNNFEIAPNTNRYFENIYINNTTIGSSASFAYYVVMSDTIVGDDASFAGLEMTGGSLGHNARPNGDLTINGGAIGDGLSQQPGGGFTTLHAGSIGNNATLLGLLMNNGSIGSGAKLYSTLWSIFPPGTPPITVNNGSIGNNATFYGDARINGGSVGAFARFEAGLQLNAGSIDDDAEFFDYETSFFNPRIQINGGSIGDRAYFISWVQIDGGSIGDDAEFRNTTIINGGTIGNHALFNGGGTFEINGGTIGDDATINRNVIIKGGHIGDRLTMTNLGRLIQLFGSQFFLDGVDITSSLPIGNSLTIFDREVMLTGILDNGNAIDLFLSELAGNQGVTDYFRSGTGIVIIRTAGATPGDTDSDGDIDDADLGAAFANYTGPIGTLGGLSAAHGDTDGDGDIDDADLGFIFAAYTGPLAPPPPCPSRPRSAGRARPRRRAGQASACRLNSADQRCMDAALVHDRSS